MTKLNNFCLAIRQHEGWFAPCKAYPNGSVSFRANNPGNLKLTPLVKELGATGVDKKGFATFATADLGFKALTQFVKMACTNQLKAYKGTMNFVDFFSVYDTPKTAQSYANAVAVSTSMPITTLINSLIL